MAVVEVQTSQGEMMSMPRRVLVVIAGLCCAAPAWASDSCRPLVQAPLATAAAHGSSAATTVHGVRFLLTPRLMALSGGWGVQVVVSARSDDGKVHGIEASPLQLSGTIAGFGRGGGFGEGRARCGSNVWPQQVVAGRAQVYTRVYPERNQLPLVPGQTLTLRVGIFGMAREDGGSAAPRIGVVQVKVPLRGPPEIGVGSARPAPRCLVR
jgi:hypothetical protein